VKLTVTAPEGTAPGKYGIRVTATPEKGEAAKLDVAVKVKQKSADKLDITGPRLSTTVTRGESHSVNVTLKPNGDFNQRVKLQAKALEGGMKTILEHASVKLDGENRDIKLTVVPSDKTPTGAHTVRVTATPERRSKER